MVSVQDYFKACRNLGDYLKGIPSSALTELYTYPAACLGIFREALPKVSQLIVLRILYVDQALPSSVLKTWVSSSFVECQSIDSSSDYKFGTSTLSGLKIWTESALPGGLTGWSLNTAFRHNLKIGLLGSGTPWTNSKNMEPDPKPKSVADLDAYALQRWEALLHYLADTQRAQQTESVSRDAIITLQHGGLMESSPDEPIPSITKEGFQFLLLDTASQVWYFIIKYLETVEMKGLRLGECLAFLFALSLDTVGKDYSTDGFSDQMQLFIQNLREFGLLHQRSRKAGRFYPTKLAQNLFSRGRKIALDTEKQKTGFIVVETNYRLYAYSDSELQLALVRMFADFSYRLPNVVVSVLTRNSVGEAMRNGISAEQIITFLSIHAHEEMIKESGNVSCPLPPSVLDQLRIWQAERNRLKYTDGALYNQFLTQSDYEVVRDYARKIGVLAHANDQKRTVVVYINGHEDVRKFWKKHSKTSGS